MSGPQRNYSLLEEEDEEGGEVQGRPVFTTSVNIISLSLTQSGHFFSVWKVTQARRAEALSFRALTLDYQRPFLRVWSLLDRSFTRDHRSPVTPQSLRCGGLFRVREEVVK